MPSQTIVKTNGRVVVLDTCLCFVWWSLYINTPSADPRAPSAPFGGNGPMGPFGVIPKPFRMESNVEWKVVTNLCL